MNTKIYDLKNTDEFEKGILAASSAIKKGGIVVFPTETVYGLGANAFNVDAVKKIYTAKGRPSDNPLIVHLADINQLSYVTDELPSKANILLKEFMPGPLTIIVRKKEIIPMDITAGLDTVAVRIPSNKYAHAFLKECELPIAAPSANISGYPSPSREEHVLRDMNKKADVILLGGNCEFGLESTVIDLTSTVPTILRPGAVSYEQIHDVLGEVCINPGMEQGSAPKAPGMKYKHYKPFAKVISIIGSNDKAVEYINKRTSNQSDSFAVAVFSDMTSMIKSSIVFDLGDRNNPYEASRVLFEILRACDEQKIDSIYIMSTTSSGMGAAYQNRLFKASDEIITL